MPITGHRVTLGLNGLGFTATETYYSRTSNFADMGPLVQVLLQRRSYILPDNVAFVGVRISDVTVKRRAQFFPPGKYNVAEHGIALIVPGGGTLGDETGGDRSDQARASLQIRLQYDGARSTSRYLAFTPDVVLNNEDWGITPWDSPEWLKWFGTWVEEMTSKRWQVKARLLTGAGAPRDIKKWSLSTSTPTNLVAQVIKTEDPGFKQNDRCVIKGVRRRGTDQTSYNGTYFVDKVVPDIETNQNGIVLRGTEGGLPDSIKNNGSITQVNYDLFDIERYSSLRSVTHKRGNSFGRRLGRRLKRVSLAQ